MDLNATLIGQMITFIFFIWFTMRFVWPPITKALAERKAQIAEGLAAAERGKRELELAQHKALEYLREAKEQAASIIEEANKRAIHLIETAKADARQECERLLAQNKVEIAKEIQKAKLELKHQITNIAMIGAEKILERNLDSAANSALVEKLITEI
ncbi:MAG: F0F1 ATP synthase subunit B [Gammaproteobacteria bacterium]